MHVSVLLYPELFTTNRGGRPCSGHHVLPDWTPYDRIGVVVQEPLGALGASLMLQLATALFYDVEPGRRRDQYPPLFVFHAGGRFGDHSPMDVWPARREVFLSEDPYEILGAVRDRAITRLLVPDRPRPPADSSAHTQWVWEAPSGWTDAASHREQLVTAYAYSPTGQVPNPDTVISTDAQCCESMVEDVLEPHRCYWEFADRDDEELLRMGAGPSSVSDLRLWLDTFRQRLNEVDPMHRQKMLEERRSCRTGTRITQSYRSVSAEEALCLLGRGSIETGGAQEKARGLNRAFTGPKPLIVN